MRRPTSNIWHQTFDLFYTSDVWHLLLNIRNLSSDVWYTVSGIRHISEIRHLTSADSRHHTYITHQTSDIWPLDIFYTSDIWHLLLNICNVSSDIWYIYIRHHTYIGNQMSDICLHQTSDIRHQIYIRHQTSSDICLHQTSDSRHRTSDIIHILHIRCLTSDFLTPGVWHLLVDFCHQTSNI